MDLFATSAALHTVFAVLWVGGMFFAHQVMRPSLGHLEGPARLKTWTLAFPRFFMWVWMAVIVMPATGYIMLGELGGFAAAGFHVTLMHGIGWLMIAIYLFVYFMPYRKLKAAVAAENWPEGAKNLAVIRVSVGFNTILGLLTVIIAVSGRFFWG